jgi:hypothetical protein
MDRISVQGVVVDLNSENMKFNENTLTEYLEKEAAFYDFFGINLARAEHELQRSELDSEYTYSDKFKEAKDDGASDKYAEAIAKTSMEYVAAKQKLQDCKLNVRKLQQHLRAWDKSHDNAQSLGFILTKEMDKLNRDRIMARKDDLDDIIKGVDPQDLNTDA